MYDLISLCSVVIGLIIGTLSLIAAAGVSRSLGRPLHDREND
jgi:hypothetical protein